LAVISAASFSRNSAFEATNRARPKSFRKRPRIDFEWVPAIIGKLKLVNPAPKG
jgi:hypothetical protein